MRTFIVPTSEDLSLFSLQEVENAMKIVDQKNPQEGRPGLAAAHLSGAWLSRFGLVTLVFTRLCCQPISPPIAAFLELILKIVITAAPEGSASKPAVNAGSSAVVEEEEDKKLKRPGFDASHHIVLCDGDGQQQPPAKCPDCERFWPDVAALRRHQVRECLAGAMERLARSPTYWERRMAQRAAGLSTSNYCFACCRLLVGCEDFLRHVRERHLARLAASDGSITTLESGAEAVFSEDEGEVGLHSAKYLAEEDGCGGPAADSPAEERQFSAGEMRNYALLGRLPASGCFSCAECGIAAMPKAAFTNHIKLLHLGLDVWAALDPRSESCRCVLCSTLFATEWELGLHRRAHCGRINAKPVATSLSASEVVSAVVNSAVIAETPAAQQMEPVEKFITMEVQPEAEADETNEERAIRCRRQVGTAGGRNKRAECKSVAKAASSACPQGDATLRPQSKTSVTACQVHPGNQHQLISPTVGRVFLVRKPNRSMQQQQQNKAPTATANMDGKHVCDLCGKIYAHANGLRLHVRTIHQPEQDFGCDSCPKRFNRPDSLVKHRLAVHNHRQDYICEFCSRAFSQSSNLIKHRRLQHPLDEASTATGEEGRRHRCEQCAGRYYSRGELARHVRISHEGAKDHLCLVCDRAFGGRPTVRRHVKRVHKVDVPIHGQHFQKLFDLLHVGRRPQTCRLSVDEAGRQEDAGSDK